MENILYFKSRKFELLENKDIKENRIYLQITASAEVETWNISYNTSIQACKVYPYETVKIALPTDLLNIKLCFYESNSTEKHYIEYPAESGNDMVVSSSPTSGVYKVVWQNTNKQMIRVINNLESISTSDALSAYQGKVLAENKAPNNHASSNTLYGLGTTTNYGHCKIINNLTTTKHTDGFALSAYQGKVLKDSIQEMGCKVIANSLVVSTSGGYAYTDLTFGLPTGATFLMVSGTITSVSGSGNWGSSKTLHYQNTTTSGTRLIVGCSVGGTSITVKTYVLYYI